MLRVGNIENWDEEVGDQIERLLYWKDRREEWLNKCLVALAPLAKRHCELPDNRIKQWTQSKYQVCHAELLPQLGSALTERWVI